jgi:hypothetical protein
VELWDFNNGTRNEILEWTRKLSAVDRAALNQKLDMLQRLDFELAISLKLLAGPIPHSGHILKLRAHGDKALRPLLCRGPHVPLREYTLLRGAEERDSKLQPDGVVDKAIENRNHVGKDKRNRVKHERA